MKTIKKMNAMKVFYYLMTVDGEVSSEELEKFNEIGYDIDSESFGEYKDSISDECRLHISTATGDEDFYDVLQEGLDEALQCESDGVSQGVSVRLLVWNMLAIAFSNDEYSDAERRIILHVVRTTKMDKSVFLEMEQLIKTAASVNREHTWIQMLDKPYAEIRPIVDELEKRQRVIVESAKALIEDEIESDIPYIEDNKRGLLDDAKAMIGEKVNPIATEIGKKTKTAADEARKKIEETVSPAAAEIKAGASKLFGMIKAKTQKKSDSDNDTAEGNEGAEIAEK